MAARPRSRAEDDDQIVLGVLTAVHEDPALTQRHISRRLGIALGLVNAYLRRCAKKGYIKISQAPPNRYAYYLTPTGFSEKMRLTTEYLAQSLKFVRAARSQCDEIFRRCDTLGWRRVAVAGLGELTEIAILSSGDFPIEIPGLVAPGAAMERQAGLRIVSDLSALDPVDAVLVTDLKTPQQTFEAMREALSGDRVFALPLLNVSTTVPTRTD